MKNKNNSNYINQPNQTKQNFYKNRNPHYQKNNYYQNYKPNLNKAGYYENKSYWKDGYDYNEFMDNHTIRPQDNRRTYKKKVWYNNYKMHNDLDLDEDESFPYQTYTEPNDSPLRRSEYNFQDERKYQERTEEEIICLNINYLGRIRTLRIYKNTDIGELIRKFGNENKMEGRLCKALEEKVRNSIKEVESIKKCSLSKESAEMINKVNKLYNE
ncbi:MAG: hypothetical protein MJ252_25565 [archaeon]|nr:hypothetical protein [archaeon]